MSAVRDFGIAGVETGASETLSPRALAFDASRLAEGRLSSPFFVCTGVPLVVVD
jgi:hypothetical protein